MAQLSSIISSILRDMVYAQHQANMYAVSLEDLYRKDERLENFALPSVAMGEIEFSLQYGVTDAAVNVEQYEINYPVMRGMMKDVSNSCADLLLSSAMPVFYDALPPNNAEVDLVMSSLGDDMKKRRDFSAFLSRKMMGALQKESTALVNDDGTMNQSAIMKIILDVGNRYLLNQEDIKEILDQHGHDDFKEKALDSMRTAVENGLPALLKDVNVMRKQMVPSVDVCVSSEELSKLPEEAIHTLRFKVSPSNINLYMNEE